MRRCLWPVMLCALALLGFALSSCTEDGTSPVGDAIDGTVLDEDGAPVAGATILISYELDITAPGKPQTGIGFSLPQPTYCHVWVETVCGEVIRTLVDGELPAGNHTAIWNAQDDRGLRVSEGAYVVQVQVGEDAEPQRREVLLGEIDYAEALDPAAWRALATTDAQGRFELEQDCLSFGHAMTGTDELGNPTGTVTVTRRVRLWAIRDGSPPCVSDWVEVHRLTGAEATLRPLPTL